MEVSALTHPSSVQGLRGPSALLRLQSDERLIALTRRGNHAAFEVLCSRYQSRLLSFCRHMLSSKEDAEDVLQEVFAAAFNAVLADEREINVRPWLYRIARNRSLNHLRRASATGVDSMDVHFADNGLSTTDKVMRRESFRELIADVHDLPETQRTALLLREIDALSYEQIAQAMETTVPSVKSLLVRARISLAEAAEARKLSCEEVRLELGETAEGLAKLSTPARRHVRTCERCRTFKRQLRDNNRALAMVMPVGPLVLLRKLVFAKLGSASAGGAHVASGAGATVGAGATIGAGAAAGGGSMAGGLMTAGAGAIATKAVAGLAAAAIVTAGAVAADHAGASHAHPRRHPALAVAAATPVYNPEPVVVHQSPQPVSTAAPSATVAAHHPHRKPPVQTPKTAVVPTTASTTSATANLPTVTAVTPPTKPAETQTSTQVTEVTTETTALPTSATSTPPPASTSTTPIVEAVPVPETTTTTGTTTTAPSTPAQPPAGEGSSPTSPTKATGTAPTSGPSDQAPTDPYQQNGGTEAPAGDGSKPAS